MRMRGFKSAWKNSNTNGATSRVKDTRDPEQVRALESLRLAKTELNGQLVATDARTAARADHAGASKKSIAA